MIEHYSDHAANERTFLAWVRTAIAVMAFGFLVERFDLFLQTMIRAAPGTRPELHDPLVGRIAGFLLILLGGAMMVIAIFRFRKASKAIDRPEVTPGTGTRIDVALAGLLVILGGVVSIYLAYTASRL